MEAVMSGVPFVAAAHEHIEPFTQSFTVTPGAAAQTFETVVPSFGYLRHIFMEVVGASGVAGTANEDAPFNVLDAVTLIDTNGAPIFGPLDGFGVYIANVLGGYAYQNSPKSSPWYVGATPNFAFGVRIPVEISHHDGMGSVANQNAAAPFKVRFTVNPSTVIWSVAPTTIPTFTIKLALEAWTLPNEVDGLGRPQDQLPPNHGTIQYWSTSKPAIIAGANYTQITRVGNLIRNLAFVTRTTAPARSDTVFPDPAILSWDARQISNETQNYRKQLMVERLLGYTRDTGVWFYGFDHSTENHAGDDNPSLWYPTVQATRLEIDGSSAAAGSMQYYVNDIAPGEINPAQRYVDTSATGFHPNSDDRGN